MILGEIDKVFGKFASIRVLRVCPGGAAVPGLRMDFNNIPMLQMMTKKMAWLSRRTEVISQNVAHSDTPGFRAKDLKQVSFQELVQRESHQTGFAAQRTNGSHLVGLKPNMPFDTERAPDAYETTIDKNDVSIEQQLAKLGETQMSYQTTLNIYRKHIDMLRMSLSRPGR